MGGDAYGVDEAQIWRGDVRQAASQSSQYRFAHGSTVLQNVMVPEAEDGIASLLHEGITAAIVCAVDVLRTVDLNDQPMFPTCEIGEVGTDRELPGELVAAEFSTFQLQPEQSFGVVAARPE